MEICQSNNSGTLADNLNVKEVKIIHNSIENITISKQCSFNFYNQVSQYLGNTIRNLLSDELNKIDRDLQRNFYFVDFSNTEKLTKLSMIFVIFFKVRVVFQIHNNS